jgi:hypothetical protein
LQNRNAENERKNPLVDRGRAKRRFEYLIRGVWKWRRSEIHRALAPNPKNPSAAKKIKNPKLD